MSQEPWKSLVNWGLHLLLLEPEISFIYIYIYICMYIYIYIFNFLYFGLCWVFVVAGLFSSCSSWELLSSCGAWASPWGDLSRWAQALGHRGSAVVVPWFQSTGPVVVVQGLSYSETCGIFLNQELNLCLLHRQVTSLPPSHQASPESEISFWRNLSKLLNDGPQEMLNI